MTDYNDGNWHRWDLSECPVHPESLVLTCHIAGGEPVTLRNPVPAHAQAWENVIAFRVTRAHCEPRDFWINFVGGHHRICRIEPSKPHGYTHVREVIE